MSKAIVAVPRSNANAGPPDHRPARHLKRPPNRRAATIKLTPDLLRDNHEAAIIPMPRHQASHPDCLCLPIQFVALQARRRLARIKARDVLPYIEAAEKAG